MNHPGRIAFFRGDQPHKGKYESRVRGRFFDSFDSTESENRPLTRFGPDDLITWEQMAVMIAKAAKLTPVTAVTNFADREKISGWAQEAIAAATEKEIMKGYPDYTFKPQG